MRDDIQTQCGAFIKHRMPELSDAQARDAATMAIDWLGSRTAPHLGTWPDAVTRGFVGFSPATNGDGCFVITDTDHGIPVMGVVNYPGDTETVARRLCAAWNSSFGKSLLSMEVEAKKMMEAAAEDARQPLNQ